MLPLALFCATACGPVVELAKNNATLELSLRAIEAFERGPVVLEASITNRGTKSLFIEELDLEGACWLSVSESWKLEVREHEGCPGRRNWPNISARLRPGETYTERRYLNSYYRSPFPAGTYNIGATWRLWTVTKRKRTIDGAEFVRDVPDRPFAMPSKTFTVTIAPATPANRWALACRLEAEFAALPPASDTDGEPDSSFLKFCDRILYAPHPELLPLYFQTLDRTPLVDPLLFGQVARTKLAESIFAADPAKAHRLFVDRLLALRADPRAFVAFTIWGQPGRELLRVQDSHFAVLQPWFWFEPKWWLQWSALGQLESLAGWAREATPRLLPDAELRRLATATNPAVRARVRSEFAHRLGKD